MKRKTEILGIGASAFREDLTALMKTVEELWKEYNINIREYEFYKEQSPFDPKSDPVPPVFEFGEDTWFCSTAINAVCNNEIICGRNVDFFDVCDIATDYKPLTLYRLEVKTVDGAISREDMHRILNTDFYVNDSGEMDRRFEYLRAVSSYKVMEFYKLDETSEYVKGAVDYNTMLRRKAWVFSQLKHLTHRELTVDLIDTIYTKTLTTKLEPFRGYRAKSGKAYNYMRRVSDPLYIKQDLNKAINEYNCGKDKTRNFHFIPESDNPGGILNFILSLTKLFLDFQKISPFYEGEYSFTAILVLNLELLKAGYPAISLDAHDIASNYHRIDAYYTQNNPMPMAYLIATYLKEAMLYELEQ